MNLEGESKVIFYCDDCLTKVYSEAEIEQLKSNKLIPYFHDN